MRSNASPGRRCTIEAPPTVPNEPVSPSWCTSAGSISGTSLRAGLPATDLLARGMFLREMDPALRQRYIQMYENVRAGL